ncbi:MAG: patatin-like phospholipase family protein [Ignavibacteriales bacterium]|nr:patatin-like phospholipase family protein [Ignavibacteriales bacterium]
MKLPFKILFLIVLHAAFGHAQQNAETKRPKIGLVLSGGGALGFAHIGVLKIIDSLGIPIDYIAGTSFGGLIGGLYAIGYRSDSLLQIVDEVDWIDMFNDTPKREILPYAEKKFAGRYHVRLPLKGITPTPPAGVIAGQKISLLLSRLTYQYDDVQHFDSLPIPFRCVGVDLITGREVVMKYGPLARAMRATMAIPSAFTPVEYGDSLLSDGGLLNNYPADVLQSMGTDIIIGVDVSAYKFSRADAKELFKVIDRAASIPRYQKLDTLRSITDIYIEPNLAGFSITDFNNEAIDQIISRGYAAAQSHIDALIELKEQITPHDNGKSDPVFVQPQPKNLLVHGIRIIGYDKLEFQFIYDLLDIKPGELFSPDLVERKINELYALGYFETITYTVHTEHDTSVTLIVTVREKSFRELNIGLHYDEFYQLIARLGVRATNLLLAGVRFESEMEFSGLFRLHGKLSYPSRSLDTPIYPFISLRYRDVPLNIHTTAVVLEYKDRALTMGVGAGLTIDKSWLFEMEIADEMTNVLPRTIIGGSKLQHHLRYGLLTISLDYIDDVFVPHKGINISSQFEYSSTILGSDFNYTRFSVLWDNYVTPSPLHTIRFGGSYFKIFDTPPLYKRFVIGGPNEFAGAEYLQINGTNFIVGRGEYRYEYKRDIFLKGILNVLVDPDIINPVNPSAKSPKFGYGISVMFTSILGPVEFIIARGQESYVADRGQQTLFHFSAGMKF